ncbi:phage antirepressor KilAC domain-containing protein [Fusobacterium polymorphum]|uniref:phage antirepressor n=1 Tax=Fusobacterium nucleatum subsp. polymorphum TaxID=76857 RepID=UPI0030CAE183
MNELQIFKNNKFGEVRTIVDKNNNAWFCLKDICDILGIENSRNVKTRIKKSYVQEIDVGINTGLATQNFKMTFVNEPGLYDCIFASNKPEALEIKDWVFEDILPSIRKTGMYLTDNIYSLMMNNPEKIGEMLIEYGKTRKENEKLILENKEKDKQITELKPAKEYVDKILSTEDTMTITQIAADYGLSGLRLNQILHQERIIRNVGGQWLLYTEHMNKGYTRSETIIIKRKDGTEKAVPATKWTQKGRLKIHQTLTELGILANVDKEKNFS